MVLVTQALERNGMQCNPSNKYLLGQFMMHHFDAARRELNLTEQFILPNDRSDAENFKYKTAVEKVLLGYFSFSYGVVINYDPKYMRPIPYARIQFIGEEKVSEFLNSFSAYSSSPNGNRKRPLLQHTNVKYKNQLELLLSAMSVSEAEVNEKGLSIQTILDAKPRSNVVGTIPVVTFVQNPWDRFISGYSDAISRVAPPKASESSSNQLYHNLQEIVNGKDPFPRAMATLSPMAGTFFEFQIDVVGQFEHLAKDLEELRGVFNLPPQPSPPQPPIQERHRTLLGKGKGGNTKKSTDNNEGGGRGSGVAEPDHLREVLSSPQNRPQMRALCHLLLIDYVCLPMYALPEGCNFLKETRVAAMEALKRREYVK